MKVEILPEKEQDDHSGKTIYVDEGTKSAQKTKKRKSKGKKRLEAVKTFPPGGEHRGLSSMVSGGKERKLPSNIGGERAPSAIYSAPLKRGVNTITEGRKRRRNQKTKYQRKKGEINQSRCLATKKTLK